MTEHASKRRPYQPPRLVLPEEGVVSPKGKTFSASFEASPPAYTYGPS